MKIGRVTADGRARVHISVGGTSGAKEEIDALLDTGFNGALALSSAQIATLGLNQRSKTRVVLAGGERRHVPTYRATVQFGTREQTVLVAEAGEPLVGMDLLWEYDLYLQCREGGHVVIEDPPPDE